MLFIELEMDLHQYTEKFNKTKTLRLVSNLLIFVGILGCLKTVNSSMLGKAPFWPLIAVCLGAIIFIISQWPLEYPNED